MTDHSPSLLPSFADDQNEAGHAMPLPTISLPAVSVPVIRHVTVSKRVRPGATVERANRSALWLAATGRWMDRSFDPAGAEAIRQNYRALPAAADEDDEP